MRQDPPSYPVRKSAMDSLQGNIERFSGFAGTYDAFRPHPPPAIVDLLTMYAGGERPRLVIDVGSGTGLSTRIWAGRADEIVGVEPNEDMREQALERTASLPDAATLRYANGLSTQTGLPDACADVVTVSQALHWLQPEPTFREIARILRPGGVFAAYDCDWPPVVHPEAEMAYNAFMARSGDIRREGSPDGRIRRWSKGGHLQRIRASGQFRYVREVVLHHVEKGNADRLVGIALSQGGVAGLLQSGWTEKQIGLDLFRVEAARTLGDVPCPWYWSYRVRIGVM
jgi:SAM-dependent methyltransferase